jgi:hypothetical protein
MPLLIVPRRYDAASASILALGPIGPPLADPLAAQWRAVAEVPVLLAPPATGEVGQDLAVRR